MAWYRGISKIGAVESRFYSRTATIAVNSPPPHHVMQKNPKFAARVSTNVSHTHIRDVQTRLHCSHKAKRTRAMLSYGYHRHAVHALCSVSRYHSVAITAGVGPATLSRRLTGRLHMRRHGCRCCNVHTATHSADRADSAHSGTNASAIFGVNINRGKSSHAHAV